LTEIQEASDEVAVQVQEISKSFESQADQAGRVVEAITNIVAVSEENASATEEISASSGGPPVGGGGPALEGSLREVPMSLLRARAS
jgi:methyl-accepting chemotaxis protein